MYRVEDSCLVNHAPSPQQCAASRRVWDDTAFTDVDSYGGSCISMQVRPSGRVYACMCACVRVWGRVWGRVCGRVRGRVYVCVGGGLADDGPWASQDSVRAQGRGLTGRDRAHR